MSWGEARGVEHWGCPLLGAGGAEGAYGADQVVMVER